MSIDLASHVWGIPGRIISLQMQSIEWFVAADFSDIKFPWWNAMIHLYLMVCAIVTVACVFVCVMFLVVFQWIYLFSHQFLVSASGMDHVRVHPRFLHSNATSHKWALGGMVCLFISPYSYLITCWIRVQTYHSAVYCYIIWLTCVWYCSFGWAAGQFSWWG